MNDNLERGLIMIKNERLRLSLAAVVMSVSLVISGCAVIPIRKNDDAVTSEQTGTEVAPTEETASQTDEESTQEEPSDIHEEPVETEVDDVLTEPDGAGVAQAVKGMKVYDSLSREGLTLKQAVVLSRHNIRSPLDGRGSVLDDMTPHEWFKWSSNPSSLSLRGGILETEMGQFFRKWLESEGLFPENYQPQGGEIRIYANSKQRTIATANYFKAGLLPISDLDVEYHAEYDTMDPVFNPQLTFASEEYSAKAEEQVRSLFSDAISGLEDNYKLLGDVLDVENSQAWTDGTFAGFSTDDTMFVLEEAAEPRMEGSLATACVLSDAMILQYYEGNEGSEAFGDQLTFQQWEDIAQIKGVYQDALFTTPLVAVNVAHPLLQEILAELGTDRKFTFLCGHDSNIDSVVSALSVEEYGLPDAIEKTSPIGCKLVFSRWTDGEGKEYIGLDMVYQTTEQLKGLSLLNADNPPNIVRLKLEGIEPDQNGLYDAQQVLARFNQAIARYDEIRNGNYSETPLRKIIIDTDAGADDASAIILASKTDGIQILGVTVQEGNVNLEQATNNALAALERVGSSVPVYKGADTRYNGEKIESYSVFGTDGMGDKDLVHPSGSAQEENAVDFILNMARSYPGQVEIIALGPATNIAMAMDRDPEAMRNVKMIWSMGTAGLGAGNASPVAEFNVYADASAYRRMLDFGIPVTVVGLDMCDGAAQWSDAQFEQLSASGDAGAFVADSFSKLREFYAQNGSGGLTMNCDSAAMLCAVNPEFVNDSIMCHGSCVTDSGETYGQVIFYKQGFTYDVAANDYNYNVTLVRDVDKTDYFNLYMAAVNSQ